MVVADDVLHAETEIELGLQRLVFFKDLALVQGPLNGHVQLFVDQRLSEEIERPLADRLDGRLDGAVAREHDDRRLRPLLADVGQQIEAVVVGQTDIDQGQVVGLAIDRGDSFGQAGGRIGLVALLAEPVRHRAQHVAIVVYQKECGLILHGVAFKCLRFSAYRRERPWASFNPEPTATAARDQDLRRRDPQAAPRPGETSRRKTGRAAYLAVRRQISTLRVTEVNAQGTFSSQPRGILPVLTAEQRERR